MAYPPFSASKECVYSLLTKDKPFSFIGQRFQKVRTYYTPDWDGTKRSLNKNPLKNELGFS